MKAIIEEGSHEIGQKMQMLALAEGAVPIHLVKALFIKVNILKNNIFHTSFKLRRQVNLFKKVYWNLMAVCF